MANHLFYTFFVLYQFRDLVKVHGVFPSSHKVSASARIIQFHRRYKGDSGEVVTPFMHVGTYPTRNFATLGPSELQPPFTVGYIQCVDTSFSLYSTWQVSDLILHYLILQSLVFLINSRSSLFYDTILWSSFSLSYRVNLPSSFNIVFSNALVLLY